MAQTAPFGVHELTTSHKSTGQCPGAPRELRGPGA